MPSLVADLPPGIEACLFDLDGVLTQTATIHAAAWKEMFDGFLQDLSERDGIPHPPFEVPNDYTAYVDGKLRLDGVRSFLASRSISLPEGTDSDPSSARTVHGLGRRKNDLVLEVLARDGVAVYEGSVRFVEAVAAAGLRMAVVSASKNAGPALESAGLSHHFEVRVDGIVAGDEGLPGKPAPDTFLVAADRLGVAAERCAVIEDAVSGVAAGRAGGFGWVIGVDRADHADALKANGADVVVADLDELLEER